MIEVLLQAGKTILLKDIANSIEKNDLTEIKNLLSQLGKTPFFKQKKPTPYDEAVSLSWYLENVFYYSVSNIFKYVKSNIFDNKYEHYDLISIGFWPGGDRDGNPFVTSEITSKTACGQHSGEITSNEITSWTVHTRHPLNTLWSGVHRDKCGDGRLATSFDGSVSTEVRRKF